MIPTGDVVQDFSDAFSAAFGLLAGFDQALLEIVWLSLNVSTGAVLIAALIGLPLGAFLAVQRFPGSGIIVALINALMGLPPVVAGLVIYMLLSRAGPLGALGLLYTPSAMVIAQAILVTPIIAAISHQVLRDLNKEYDAYLRSLGASRRARIATLLWDGRYSLVSALLAGFGRASAEVGAIMIVGGNIDHVTRMMTTAIALETSKGNLELALALGIVLVSISLAINGAILVIRNRAERRQYA
ncbi:MAG: ABC transporter permease [Rhizobiaceae bacterium]